MSTVAYHVEQEGEEIRVWVDPGHKPITADMARTFAAALERAADDAEASKGSA